MNPGDIYFGYFLQEEGEFADRRPFLVLIAEQERVFAAKITTSPIRGYCGVHLDAGRTDMSEGNLAKESYVNLARTQWIPKTEIIMKIGSLRKEVYEAVLCKLKI